MAKRETKKASKKNSETKKSQKKAIIEIPSKTKPDITEKIQKKSKTKPIKKGKKENKSK